MEIKLAGLSDKQELLEIWREAFGDSDGYIAGFLDGYFMPEYNAPVGVIGGQIVSVLYMLEFGLYAGMKAIGRCAYLFAAATRREHRGRGYMGRLIEYAAELYKNRGVAAIFLFPQGGDGKLFDYYAKFGFAPIYQAGKLQPAGRAARDLTGLRLVNHEIDNVEIFDGLYQAYADFTARQSLSPLKDRLFYYKCASSYLEEPGRYFGVLENNVEEFCYVFYKKFENNYYIDDIIIVERGEPRVFSDTAGLLADYILSLGDGIKLEGNVLPESFGDSKLAMILSLDKRVDAIIAGLETPVYLNMFMNI